MWAFEVHYRLHLNNENGHLMVYYSDTFEYLSSETYHLDLENDLKSFLNLHQQFHSRNDRHKTCLHLGRRLRLCPGHVSLYNMNSMWMFGFKKDCFQIINFASFILFTTSYYLTCFEGSNTHIHVHLIQIDTIIILYVADRCPTRKKCYLLFYIITCVTYNVFHGMETLF